MSGYPHVSEEPKAWDEGFIQMLGDPAHYRRTEMHVVDYSAASVEAGPRGWEPLIDPKPEPEQPPSRWALLKAAIRAKA
jgi:hypothetical protein